MFLRTCKAFFDKKQKDVRKFFSSCKKYQEIFSCKRLQNEQNNYSMSLKVIENHSMLFTFDVCSIRDNNDDFTLLKLCNFFQKLINVCFPYVFHLY